ncbi:Rieske 2Fe-2S domain-containing protein [Pararhizobium sp. YC-54]|uniref:aromatic ring-hydroxylating oxygenase subunit alpha n=1 Tax=Pararhizobium sp. YC-54 TaxID=2986920 RepID=UPI0021F7D222|nr:SRPBCC family protein [Pararhizobium sp. YC-54]MCV9999371.1 Rieske 2Fe-2S domain-containing protein [Pararhizobium sp. YC-54]
MNSHVKLDPVGELVANVSVPFERAKAMPKSVYTSPDFMKLELERVFSKDWICAGRSSSLAKPGDYITMSVAGTPVIVIRDREGKLRALSNVCLHRMSTLLEGSGNVKAIVCPYHAWTYNLTGELRGAAGMGLNAGFCKEDYKLPQFRCEDWLGWIMITLNPDIEGPSERLRDVSRLVGHYGMEHYVESFRETHVWNTNWKVLAENFMESYHLPMCHRNTIGGQVSLEQMDCPTGFPTFNYHWALKSDDQYLALAHPNNHRLAGDDRRRTYLLSIYPGLFISLSPGYFWYLALHPRSPGEVDMIYGGGLSPEFLADEDSDRHFASLKELLDHVNVEDKGCTEKVYRGLLGSASDPGHLSHLERPNYEFAQYLAGMIK